MGRLKTLPLVTRNRIRASDAWNHHFTYTVEEKGVKFAWYALKNGWSNNQLRQMDLHTLTLEQVMAESYDEYRRKQVDLLISTPHKDLGIQMKICGKHRLVYPLGGTLMVDDEAWQYFKKKWDLRIQLGSPVGYGILPKIYKYYVRWTNGGNTQRSEMPERFDKWKPIADAVYERRQQKRRELKKYGRTIDILRDDNDE